MWTVGDVEAVMEVWAPVNSAMPGDNVGLLSGRRAAAVKTVLTALDITPAVIDEAVSAGAGLIVAHHPIFREPLMGVTDDTPAGELLMALAENRVAAICMHTNLDAAAGGVNDALAMALGLDCLSKPIEPETGIGRYGDLPEEITAEQLALLAKGRLGCGSVRLSDTGRPVKRLAVCGGSGGSLIEYAFRAGCDAFLAGEFRHNHFLEAAALGVSLLECGHFATENVVVERITARLREKLPGLEVIASSCQKEPYTCL